MRPSMAIRYSLNKTLAHVSERRERQPNSGWRGTPTYQLYFTVPNNVRVSPG